MNPSKQEFADMAARHFQAIPYYVGIPTNFADISTGSDAYLVPVLFCDNKEQEAVHIGATGLEVRLCEDDEQLQSLIKRKAMIALRTLAAKSQWDEAREAARALHAYYDPSLN